MKKHRWEIEFNEGRGGMIAGQHTFCWYKRRKCFELGQWYVWAKTKKEAISLLRIHLGITFKEADE